MSKKVWLGLALLACLLALPTAAHAQSAIAGVVKDSSGAVLPGVTVEAASDVLIEKSKVVVTDGSGAYKIIGLRPGTYVVTFTLTGFQTFKREGFEIPSDFTANLDAAMKVGALEESVTVSGASPVVDVQSNVKSQVLSREVLDAVPNAHTIQSVGQLIPGVTLTSPDVGGSAQMQQTYFSVHGTGANGTSMTVDGMIINGLMLDGAVQTYMNDATAQEMVYRTGGGGGEQQTGGLQINVVPREGGNRFSGQFNFGWEKWQSDNFGDELKAVGVTSVDKLGTYHDISATEGGPIKKDRLWWFVSGRLSLEKKPVANTTNSAALTEPVLTDANASAAALAACRATGSGCPQGISDETVNSANGRLTLQLNSKMKLSAYLDRIHKDRASAIGARDDQRITGVHWDSPMYMTNSVKLTATVSSRLLVQGGWSSNIERYNNKYQAGIEQPAYSPLWYTMAHRVADNTFSSVAGAIEYGSYPDRYNWQGSASYVTGSHNVTVGFQDSFGTYNQRYYANADLYQNYTTSNGVLGASSISAGASSPWWDDKLNYGLGVYAQDNWTMKRLTLNYGVREDMLLESVVGQPANFGTFADIPAYGDKKMPKQTNFEPHASIIYDLFGNGKTAVRAGYNRYVNGATTTLASGQDPGSNPTAAPKWNDVNGDNVVQYQITHDAAGHLLSLCGGSPGTTSFTYAVGCELDWRAVSTNYGQVAISNVQDPNLKRAYQNKWNAGISHELLKGVSVSAEWFRTENKDSSQTFNLTRLQPCNGLAPVAGMSVADSRALIACNEDLSLTQIAANPQFQLINVFSPIDGHVVPVYDTVSTTVSSATAQNFLTTDPLQKSTYTGFDIGVNARLPRGGRLFGGTTTERTISNNCNTAIDGPGGLLYCDKANLGGGYTIPWKTQIKLSGTYPLPWLGLIVNGSYQGLPGYTIGTTSYSITKGTTKYTTCPGDAVAQGCVAGAVIAPTAVNNLTATLDPAGTTLTPRNNQVDFGIAKRLKFGRLRIDPKIDLFNALNSDDYYSVVSTTFTPATIAAGQPTNVPATPANATGTQFPSYHQPARFLQGRIVRLGANITW